MTKSKYEAYDKGIAKLAEETKKLIKEGDSKANYVHYAIHRLKILPSMRRPLYMLQ